jgi:hypothetical protein
VGAPLSLGRSTEDARVMAGIRGVLSGLHGARTSQRHFASGQRNCPEALTDGAGVMRS